jgi:hypothetical protein
MEDNPNPHGFLIPESFLTQLGEYTRGYMLLVCNERGELFSHEAYDNPVIKLGLIKFADLHVSAALEHMHAVALREEQHHEEADNNTEDKQDEGEDDSEEGY